MQTPPTVLDREAATLESLGLDEAWLEHWILEDPKRLGLGARLRALKPQVTRPANSGSGRLDLQFVDDDLEDRVYDIELQRGQLDASHGFRALDYWAREQKADEADREHIPVIVAEHVRASRYSVLLHKLAEVVDLITLEVKCILVDKKPVVWIEPAILPDDRYPNGDGEVVTVEGLLTRKDWESKSTDDFLMFFKDLEKRANGWGLTNIVNWSAKAYIALWKNSRCWCPVWPRKGAEGRLYLPAPTEWGKGSVDAPPEGFPEAASEFEKLGIRLVWAWSYNMGANPVAVTLSLEDLGKPEVKSLLESSWRAIF